MADGLFALGGTGEFTGATPYSGACFTNNLGTTDGARHRHAPCGGSRGRLSVMTATTSGITSPARRTMTVSPMRTSKRAIWSALCKVTLVTVTPATCTGSGVRLGWPHRCGQSGFQWLQQWWFVLGPEIYGQWPNGGTGDKPHFMLARQVVEFINDAINIKR